MIKCPKCEQDIQKFRITTLDGIGPDQRSWKCIAHTCPHCSTVISAQMDPVSLHSDTVNAVRHLLMTLPRRS